MTAPRTTQRRDRTQIDVIDAAADIVDREGADALSLSLVARELGIKPPSLYNHIDGLDHLKRQLALRTLTEIGESVAAATSDEDDRAVLRAVAIEMRRFAGARPGMYMISSRAHPGDDEIEAASNLILGPIFAVLERCGIEGDEAVHAARTMRSAVHGFILLEANGGFGLDIDLDRSFDYLVDRLAETITSGRS